MKRFSPHPLKSLVALAFFFAVNALAQNTPVPSDVFEVTEAKLVSEYDAVPPDQSFFVGLVIDLKKPWHTYWVNPGDSGAPIKVDIKSSHPVTLVSEMTPPPIRIDTGRIVTFGYESSTLLAFELKSPSSLRVGDVLKLSINAEWLVCADVCIPALKEMTLELPVRSLKEISKSKDSTLFDDLRLVQPTEFSRAPQINPNGIGLSAQDPMVIDVFNPSLVQQNQRLRFLDYFPFRDSKLANQLPANVRIDSSSVKFTSFKMKSATAEQEAKPTGFYRFVNQSSKQDSFFIFGKSPSIVTLTTGGDAGPSTVLAMLTFAFFALVGGLLLNLMPCVFPILSLKVFKLVKSNAKERKSLQKENLFYALGCVLTFISLGAIILLFQKTGDSLGWGFQLQSIEFVSVLAILFFVLSLNFLDVFEFPSLPLRFSSKSSNAHVESFISGVMAVVVASPCTAPFMGASLGYALSRSPFEVLVIFSSLGIGLASPYVVLSYSPYLLSQLPKPGPWMIKLKQFMAFPMLLTTLWLVWLGAQLVSINQATILLGLFILISMIFWFSRSRWAWALIFAASLLTVWQSTRMASFATTQTTTSQNSDWAPFSRASLAQLQDQGHAVFVNFTADWCITCKVNELNVFTDPKVKSFFESANIKLMTGDWTKRNSEITEFLRQHQRAGVPLYIFYPAGSKDGVLLPEILTPDLLIERITNNTKP